MHVHSLLPQTSERGKRAGKRCFILPTDKRNGLGLLRETFLLQYSFRGGILASYAKLDTLELKTRFSSDQYETGFKKVVDLAATYGGAVITVEGHSDPLKYNKLKKKGAAKIVLNRTKQAAKNLSMNRSLAVRNSIVKYAVNNGVPLDESQFTVIGHGITQPKYPNPKTKEQWLENMRVVFRIIQIEAEESVFEPLD